MGAYRKKYDEDFKKNAVKLSYASPKSVKEIAEDLGIHENLLYNWRRKYTADGRQDEIRQWLEEENRASRGRQLAEARMERDIQKSSGLLRESPKVRYRILYLGNFEYPVAKWAGNSANRANRILCLAQESGSP